MGNFRRFKTENLREGGYPGRPGVNTGPEGGRKGSIRRGNMRLEGGQLEGGATIMEGKGKESSPDAAEGAQPCEAL